MREVAWSVPKSVTDGNGILTNFQFTDPTAPDPMSVTITNPDGTSKGYATIFCDTSPACTLAPNYMRLPTHFRDENARDWLYAYDNHGRPLTTTNPQGGVKSVSRDVRGNLTEIRNKAATGFDTTDIVSSAGYTTCTSLNYKYCNKPTYTIDPRGGRWDFQYDQSSGGLAVSLAPADANGVRAVTRYTHAAFPFGPVSLPAQLSSPGVFLLSAKDTCLTSAVMSGTVDFSYMCSPPNRVQESYTYAPESLELAGVKPDTDNNIAITAYTYDAIGNMTASADLMGNISFSTYDILRRKVFEIGPDPDGAGPLPRPMIRHVYDGNGNEIQTETGAGLQADGSDFAVTKFVRRTFDLNDQLVKIEEVTP